MYRVYRVVIVLAVALLAAGCETLTGPGSDDGGKAISSAAQAQSAFALLKASAETVDRKVSAPFNGTTSVPGDGGTAAVSGRKTSSSSSSASSSSSSRMSDLQIDFASFAVGQGAVSGGLRWFDSYYSRTACSSSSCASSTDHYESIKGAAIRIRFVHDGETLTDEVTVEANSPEYTARWTVKITTRDGQVFTFSA